MCIVCSHEHICVRKRRPGATRSFQPLDMGAAPELLKSQQDQSILTSELYLKILDYNSNFTCVFFTCLCDFIRDQCD